jgi:Na+/proline symporter
VRDILPPLVKRPLPLLVARLFSPFYGAVGLAVSLALNRDVLETLKLGYSIFAAGVILPVLAALLGKSTTPGPRGAIAAMICGGAVAAAGRLFPGSTGRADPVLAGTGVNLLVLLVSILAARWTKARRPAAA